MERLLSQELHEGSRGQGVAIPILLAQPLIYPFLHVETTRKSLRPEYAVVTVDMSSADVRNVRLTKD